MINDVLEERIKFQNINMSQLTFSVFEIVRKVERGDIQLEGEFQRKQKWTLEKKSRLIESIILDIPIQAIYLSEESDYKNEIIDGQQRIRTITEFLNNKFKLESNIFIKEDTYFRNLEPSIQRKIQDFQIPVFIFIIRNQPDIKFEIFERINSGASKLNSQELRNCIYRNNGIPFIKELADEWIFRRVMRKNANINSLKDQELILRFMSFYYKGIEGYTGNLKKFLNDTLENYEQYRYREKEFKEVFIDTMNNIYTVFENDAFVIRTKGNEAKYKINIALFEILTFSFAKYSSVDIKNNSENIKNRLACLITENQKFKESITSASTTTKGNTYERFEIWQESLKEILGGK